ncbi:LEAF RUST 10 DISEASE-RESISTANCE LOCUS RECEPTOR-LIKE PROTEIN KINASE-like 1.1 isoform X1 [Impatiens glandulifera]|uniref:LEAF RUST 10 DISEASE-RESISTANCE LOCUS RECEPTOR-LIKE PROTEIN KINASE-like 1.1 isoform X1 n=1 Tax=Impatiens glandulifera TaxID=253017 RepID=UPI001FB0E0BE|nr:LEAF RUST 10 DISEASE-RESISTANCE LOCUS RECEPTOR-LIKE PROTEIN KINASE-like 1.1 isoform X1 [Impatiens glandulifera]
MAIPIPIPLIPSVFSLFLLSCVLFEIIAGQPTINETTDKTCPNNISCGSHGILKFPLTNFTYPGCGLCSVDCSDGNHRPRIQVLPTLSLESEGDLNKGDFIAINDSNLTSLVTNQDCGFVDRFIGFRRPSELPSSNSRSGLIFSFFPNMTVFKCSKINGSQRVDRDNEYFVNYTFHDCENYLIYYNYGVSKVPDKWHPTCSSPIYVPVVSPSKGTNMSDLFSLLASRFTLEFHVSERCTNCFNSGGRNCLNGQGQCIISNDSKKGRNNRIIIIGTVLSGSFVMVGIVILIFCQRKRLKLSSYLPFLRNSSSNPSSKRDLEGATEYFGASVFTYEELVEATKSFDPSKELGDGGFGTVYHGKLSDGREVAVKRLYEHNYKRVMQFMNEVQILTRLRHRNLVTLYGCTSRHSRELLLVYEYICNGTVADHLNGHLAEKHLLTWPVRMNIAIETAAALAYLHHSDIIHRDVKTTNILLDTNFSVKVADFGLSKSLPENATHVSTAPQGTPGYVDPEYYQCYQLTEKSDVYSFGVVLVELISSMPAVDIGRHRHEINLSNLAINKIQNCAFDDLIDSSLGYKCDVSVKRMTTSVAELAFRCLQNEKDFRPTMDEIVESLKEIRDYIDDDKTKQGLEEMKMPPPPSPEGDHINLIKSCYPGLPGMSPNTVTAKWVSGSSINSS